MKIVLERILVVEDRAAQREELVYDLIESGYKAKGAANSRQAILSFGEFSPQMVIMDIDMGRKGEIDGVAIASMLRQKENPFSLVFLTGEEYRQDDTQHLSPQAFLRKDGIISIDDLLIEINIAWKKFLAISPPKPKVEKYRLKVSKEEILHLSQYDDGRYKSHEIELCPYSGSIRLSDIVLIKTVPMKRKSRILMKNGVVFRNSMRLSEILRIANKRYLVQIKQNCIINALHIEDLECSPDGDYVLMPILSFGIQYDKLPIGEVGRIGQEDLFLSREFRKEAIVKIEVILQEKTDTRK